VEDSIERSGLFTYLYKHIYLTITFDADAELHMSVCSW